MEQIEREALELPPEQRARLVDKLWESLGETTEPVLSQEWQMEIERRRREILEGNVKAVPGDEVSRRAWASANSRKP
jgi:putative addiction module component (TIGR02574 family)